MAKDMKTSTSGATQASATELYNFMKRVSILRYLLAPPSVSCPADSKSLAVMAISLLLLFARTLFSKMSYIRSA